MRAFLMDESAGGMTQCVKQPSAYIEAEFFVDTPSMPTARGFMFGHPSIWLSETKFRDWPNKVM